MNRKVSPGHVAAPFVSVLSQCRNQLQQVRQLLPEAAPSILAGCGRHDPDMVVGAGDLHIPFILQDLCPVGNGMHGEPLVGSQRIKVYHLLLDILSLIAQFLVPVLLEDALELCDDHILLRRGQLLYEIDKSVSVKPVVSVQQAEIFPCRRLDGGIHG